MCVCVHGRIPSLRLNLKQQFWEILSLFIKIYDKGKNPSGSFSTGIICFILYIIAGFPSLKVIFLSSVRFA